MAEAARIISIAALRYHVPAVAAAFALLAVGPGVNSTAVAQQAGQPQQAQQQQQYSAAQISQLVAPIALYPDNLLGQVLAASTYPLDIVVAARWSSSNQNVTGQALDEAMQLQSWDPSVKALTGVPQVLQMMSEKLEWTQQLGAAYLAQPDDIAAAVQRLRARADASGNLKETKQIKVRREAAPPPPPAYAGEPLPPEYIVIEPYEPDYLYVPIYDPWVVYGPWPYPAWRPFYWYPPGYVAVGIIGFGAPCYGVPIWARYHWGTRRVVVDVHRFDRAHGTRLASLGGGGTKPWSQKSEFSSKDRQRGPGSPPNFAGKPPGNNGFNANGPGGNNSQRFERRNPNGGSNPNGGKTLTNLNGQGGNTGKTPTTSQGSGGQGTTKTVGVASTTNQGGGTTRVRSHTPGNGTFKPNPTRVTSTQSFKQTPSFRAAPAVRSAPRVQHQNNNRR